MTTRKADRKRKPTGPLALGEAAPDVMLMDSGEVREVLRAALASREWWVIPAVSERAHDLMGALERAYYAGDANRDFRILTGAPDDCGVWAVALAHKRRAGPAAVAAIMSVPGESRDDTARTLERQDVLVCMGGPSAEAAAASVARATRFGLWLGRED